jgi:hypothetical protein
VARAFVEVRRSGRARASVQECQVRKGQIVSSSGLEPAHGAAHRIAHHCKAAGAGFVAVAWLLAGPALGQAATERHHWWRDAALTQQLALTAKQQTQLDAAFAKSLEVRRAGSPQKARVQFHEALQKGDAAGARQALQAWTGAEQTQVRAGAELKLEAMNVLSAEQWKKLVSQRPELLRQAWTPRPSWPAPGSGNATAPGARGPADAKGSGSQGPANPTGGAAPR